MDVNGMNQDLVDVLRDADSLEKSIGRILLDRDDTDVAITEGELVKFMDNKFARRLGNFNYETEEELRDGIAIYDKAIQDLQTIVDNKARTGRDGEKGKALTASELETFQNAIKALQHGRGARVKTMGNVFDSIIEEYESGDLQQSYIEDAEGEIDSKISRIDKEIENTMRSLQELEDELEPELSNYEKMQSINSEVEKSSKEIAALIKEQGTAKDKEEQDRIQAKLDAAYMKQAEQMKAINPSEYADEQYKIDREAGETPEEYAKRIGAEYIRDKDSVEAQLMAKSKKLEDREIIVGQEQEVIDPKTGKKTMKVVETKAKVGDVFFRNGKHSLKDLRTSIRAEKGFLAESLKDKKEQRKELQETRKEYEYEEENKLPVEYGKQNNGLFARFNKWIERRRFLSENKGIAKEVKEQGLKGKEKKTFVEKAMNKVKSQRERKISKDKLVKRVNQTRDFTSEVKVKTRITSEVKSAWRAQDQKRRANQKKQQQSQER